MIKDLPERKVTVLDSDYAKPAQGSPYTGQYAIVKIPGQDKLSILYASKTGANDGVRYVTAPNTPVFGYNFAQRETYEEANSPRLRKMKAEGMSTPVRDVALVVLKREQRRLDHVNSIPIMGQMLSAGAVDDVGEQIDLTGAFSLVNNPRTSEREAVFQTVGDVFETDIPRDGNTEYFYDNDTGQTIYDAERQYRLSHIWLAAGRNRFEQDNPKADYNVEFPVHAAALAQLNEMALKK